MLNFQLMTAKDRKEAAAVERRRALDEERKKRIFNPRERLFGIDREGLQQQIEEKKQRDAEQKKIDQIFEAQRLKDDQIALDLETKEREERKKVMEEINVFRANYQKSEDRREYDLNDPNAIKRGLPARLLDDDPRLGLSSVQKFEGEDLASEERNRIQREQMKAWLDQQLDEKEAAEKERKCAEDAFRSAVIARDTRALQLDSMEKECRKRLDEACFKFNRALADERNCAQRLQKRRDIDDNIAEIYNILTSPMMTENPEVAQSSLGPDRQIGSLYKGMTPEQKVAFFEEQKKQIEENKKRRDEESRHNREWDDYVNGMQKTVALLDREQQKKQRESNKALAEENKRMGIEQKLHNEYLEKIVYSNKPTAAFYDQFNKSTR